jgi:response regulator RpfG family c-di-GMP phosphodiesterase
MLDDDLLGNFEKVQRDFQEATNRLIRDLKRQNKILERTDKRQRKEFDELMKLKKEIEDTQKEVVFTMGSIGETRSRETGNHVRRVAEYSKLLALKYGLSEEDSEILKEVSPMHDIGKVAIPDAILNKPAKFTPEEFEIMKTHAKNWI